MIRRIATLKADTREMMVNRYYAFTPLLLLYFVLDFIANMIPATLFTGTDPLNGIMMTGTSFILNVLLGLTGVGLIKAALDCAKGETFSVSALFYAFSNRPNRFVIIQLIFTAIKTALSTPEILLNRYALSHEMNVFDFYGIYACFIFGVLFITMLLTLRLIWANYYLLENYNMDAGEALKKSLSFSRGKTFEIFYMKISFFGMFVLSYLSFMIGFIYVRPYAEVTYASYYLQNR